MKKAAVELNGERGSTPALPADAATGSAGPASGAEGAAAGAQRAEAGAAAGSTVAGAGAMLGSSPPGVGAGGHPPKRRASRSAPLPADDADCTLCLKLMFEPVTTPWCAEEYRTYPLTGYAILQTDSCEGRYHLLIDVHTALSLSQRSFVLQGVFGAEPRPPQPMPHVSNGPLSHSGQPDGAPLRLRGLF